MRKLLNVILSLTMCMMCFGGMVHAENILGIEPIPIELGEAVEDAPINNEEGGIYSFELEERGAVSVNADFTFETAGEKEVSISVMPESFLDDMLGGLFGGTASNLQSNGENIVTTEDSVSLSGKYILDAGVYWVVAGVTGEYDEETWEEVKVEGTFDLTVDKLAEDAYTVDQVTFRFKKSKYTAPIDPVTLEYIHGESAPQVMMMGNEMTEREHYTMDGYYAYRKRDNAWLYAKEVMVSDEWGDAYSEYQDYSWYPLGAAPEGYVRYAVVGLVLGTEEFAMDTMQDGDVVILREVWSGDPYVVRYHANVGGKGTMKNSYFNYDKTKKLRANTFTHKTKDFAGWKARRDSDQKWYYTNGTDTGWYKEGKQPKGWKKYIFEEREAVKNLTEEYYDIIHMYAIWR